MRLSSFFTLIVAFALCTMVCEATVLSPESALNRVTSTQNGKLRAPAKSAFSAAASHPACIVNDSDGEAAVYVFNNDIKAMSTNSDGPGFIIVAADDCVPALLGYSNDGYVDPADMPPALTYWLNEYAAQIAYARENAPDAVGGSTATATTDKFEPIEPLCSSRWCQSYPYNMLCPMENGKQCVTGCVATSMAQVMRYHKWPEKGQSSNSYHWNDTVLSVDFSNITFRWDEILDFYEASSTMDQRLAAAELNYCCGVAVNMDYSPTASGASTYKCAQAYIPYFNYDKGLRYVQRQYHTLDEWQTIVYNELRDNGPVQYSGQSDEGGHSFVCDGYSSDGYFHINWGWGGVSDGYFLLTALDPETQGIGGTTSGYNTLQDVVVDVKRPVDGSVVYPTLCFRKNFDIRVSKATVGSAITIYGPVYSYSVAEVSGSFGLKFVSKTDSSVVLYGTGTSFSNLKPYYGYSQFIGHIPQDIPEGVYTVTPVVKNAESDVYVPCEMIVNNVHSYTVTIEDGIATFVADGTPSINVTDVSLKTPFFKDLDFQVTATIENPTENDFYGSVSAAIFDENNNLKAYGESYLFDLAGGESMPLDYVSSFKYYSYSNGAPAPGEYYFAIVDHSTLNPVSPLTKITLRADPDSIAVLATTPVVNDGDTHISQKDGAVFTTDISCAEGFFAGTVQLCIFPYPSGKAIDTLSSDYLFLPADSTTIIEFDADLDKYETGKQYMAAVFNGSNQISSYDIFTVDNTTGADFVVPQPEKVTIFDLRGVMVTSPNPAPGFYIRVVGDKAEKVFIK